MDTLFAHSGFRLILIDDNGDMSLIIPHEHKEDIIKNGYRCISHVWATGTQKEHVWKDHPIKNVDWEVEVREEKHERLLEVFSHHKGYFWMDVFCTNQQDVNKPLDVMGDIYMNCVECICLFNTICTVNGFISEKDVLISLAKNIKEHVEIAKDFYEKHGEEYEEFSRGQCEKYLAALSMCSWFRRVWTWQEAALPPKLLFCCEQAGEYKYDPFDQEFLKELFPYEFLRLGFADIFQGNAGAIEELKQLIRGDESLFKILRCLFFVMGIGRTQSIWDNVVTLAMSRRKCTEERDYVYGIAGILNLVVPKELTLDEAKVEFEKSLKRQGIFIKDDDFTFSQGFTELRDLITNVTPIDGIIVLGRVDDDTALKFDPNVVRECESHGKILSKEHHVNEMYEHVCWKYVTETSTIYLETDRYNVGDILETTRIGREGCTYQHGEEDYKNDEIFEIISDRVRVIGHINDSIAELSDVLSAFEDSSESDEYEE